MAGYPLPLTGAVCVGALACGPSTQSTTGSGEGSSSTGFDLTRTSGSSTTTSTTNATGTPATTDATTEPPMTTTSPDGSSSSSDGGPPECEQRGQICGEFLVCQCDCDFSVDCCGCLAADCTQDSHCEGICENVSETGTWVELACVPPACNGSSFDYAYVQTDAETMNYAGETCLGQLLIFDSALLDLSPLASLEYVHHELAIDTDTTLASLAGLEVLREVGGLSLIANTTLSNLDALAGLEEIRDGGMIRDNPSLDRADIDAFLAGVQGGDAVMVCGNLNDAPC